MSEIQKLHPFILSSDIAGLINAIQLGSDIELECEGEIPLTLAIAEDNIPVIRILLDAGADVNSEFANFTPLNKAIMSGRIGIVKLLIDAGADVNLAVEDDVTPLMEAASSDSADLNIVNLLIESGADINAKDRNGFSTLNYAISSENSTVFDYLNKLIHGDQADEVKIVKSLFQSIECGNIEEFLQLLDAGVDINARDEDGWTPLIYAVYKSNIEMINHLLQMDAELEIKSKGGNTALCTAIDTHDASFEIVRTLIEAGADVKSPNVLIAAVCQENPEIVELLINSGADLSYTDIDTDNLYALDLAFDLNSDADGKNENILKIIKLLQDAGAPSSS